ncbi:hypothetical protein FACS1894137_08950 [Spirochaetia bacterium]|nr:hypothetical protein FACS1894137_08950 [Spirochaetia bacterium]
MKTSLLWIAIVLGGITACVSSGVTSAEEYFSIGMAYFDLEQYENAEKWLERARGVDKTKLASEYNLGRIAYETGRFDEAVRYFDRVLARDADNVLALKAAAYARIKIGDLAAAESLYDRVLELEPENTDQGYNYALVLMAMDKSEEAEAVLLNYKITMADNKDTLLLLARVQKALHKVEAADAYSQWLEDNKDTAVQYEYAQVLESFQFYARALEEYRALIDALPAAAGDGPDRAELRFSAARLLLIADSEKEDGVTEMETAVSEGFKDTEKLTALLAEPNISAAHKDDIRRIIADLEKKAEPDQADQAEQDSDTVSESP